ncbi:hypothetical protein DFJ73DRAFT_757338 [Zopfochytrium polystomum]|nr:hypothetical protein DFJ73DRAFT_757338 [Zopfochytrium polystomum]
MRARPSSAPIQRSSEPHVLSKPIEGHFKDVRLSRSTAGTPLPAPTKEHGQPQKERKASADSFPLAPDPWLSDFPPPPFAHGVRDPHSHVAPTVVRTQTVRSNLDNFRIEQIALRRLRFIIDHDEAKPEHLSIVDLVQKGDVPASLITRYFGAQFKTAHDIRIILLQAIERTRRRRFQQLRIGCPLDNSRPSDGSSKLVERHLTNSIEAKELPSSCEAVSGTILTTSAIPPKATQAAIRAATDSIRRATTPKEILQVLRQAEGGVPDEASNPAGLCGVNGRQQEGSLLKLSLNGRISQPLASCDKRLQELRSAKKHLVQNRTKLQERRSQLLGAEPPEDEMDYPESSNQNVENQVEVLE